MSTTRRTALSLKQPWAALVAHAVKVVEVRRWATAHLGPLLIHAARVDDPRPEAWACVPPELLHACEMRGGVIAEVNLVGCEAYRDEAAFLAGRGRHLNDPSWYEAGLFGWALEGARVLPFVRAKGNVRLFGVEIEVRPPDAVTDRLSRLERGRPKS